MTVQAVLVNTERRSSDFALLAGAALLFTGLTYGQRIGWVVDPDHTQQLPVCVLTTYAAIFIFFAADLLRFDLKRLALYCISIPCLILSTLLLGSRFSSFSFYYILILYTPFVFVMPVGEDSYRRTLGIFQVLLVPIAAIAMFQFACRVLGIQLTDYLKLVVPNNLLLVGYNTYAYLAYDFQFVRSNGIFFLEPSFVSQFMAVGLVIEWIYFRRYWLLCVYAGAMAASLSGTGVLLLGITFAYIFIRQGKPWPVVCGAIAWAALLALSQYSEILQYFVGRVGEFNATGSSAFARFVGPIVAIPDAMGNNFIDWLVGFGPGNAKTLQFSGYQISPFAFSKLMLEYGMIGTIPFMFFINYCIFTKNFARPFAIAMFAVYNVLSGSLQQPHTIFLVWLVACLLVPSAESIEAAKEERNGRRDSLTGVGGYSPYGSRSRT